MTYEYRSSDGDLEVQIEDRGSTIDFIARYQRSEYRFDIIWYGSPPPPMAKLGLLSSGSYRGGTGRRQGFGTLLLNTAIQYLHCTRRDSHTDIRVNGMADGKSDQTSAQMDHRITFLQYFGFTIRPGQIPAERGISARLANLDVRERTVAGRYSAVLDLRSFTPPVPCPPSPSGGA